MYRPSNTRANSIGWGDIRPQATMNFQRNYAFRPKGGEITQDDLDVANNAFDNVPQPDGTVQDEAVVVDSDAPTFDHVDGNVLGAYAQLEWFAYGLGGLLLMAIIIILFMYF